MACYSSNSCSEMKKIAKQQYSPSAPVDSMPLILLGDSSIYWWRACFKPPWSCPLSLYFLVVIKKFWIPHNRCENKEFITVLNFLSPPKKKPTKTIRNPQSFPELQILLYPINMFLRYFRILQKSIFSAPFSANRPKKWIEILLRLVSFWKKEGKW